MPKDKYQTQLEYMKRSGYAAQKKYDEENIVRISLKLNKRKDVNILKAIEGKSKQTEIKRLLNVAIAAEKASTN